MSKKEECGLFGIYGDSQAVHKTYFGLFSLQPRGQVAIAHNGNLINASLLRDEYEAYGSIFKSTSDTEIIAHLLAKPSHVSKADPVGHVLNHLQGAYSLLFLFSDRIEAARDPYGVRPLCVGKTKEGAWVA